MEDVLLIQTTNFELTQLDFIKRVLVALGIGLVLGLEREFSSLKKDEIFAGLRTLSIVSLLGFVCALLNHIINPWFFSLGFLSVIVLVSISYWVSANKGEIGSTTEFTSIFTYLLGGLTFWGYIELSLAFTVIIVVLLSLKLRFKSIVGQITQTELSAFIRFVIIALLILPFLPNTNFGPYNVINPSEIGWIIVLTSGIGFVGYILMKFLDSKIGLLLTGVFGGMVSSTIVSWVFSKRSKEHPHLSSSYAIAIFASATVMIGRVLVWVFIFNPSMLYGLILPILIMLLTAIGVTFYFYKKHNLIQSETEKIPLGEPLNIRDAVFFGFIYTAILVLVSFASTNYGDRGIYISSAISALTDINAITISMSKLGGNSVQFLTAQNAILLATLTNTLVKIGLTLWFGSKQLKKHVLLGYGLVFIAGIIGFIILNNG
ncbi:MgtC/SapB family protein [Xanthomarina sp.]|uniref:MgtC/SapB family protein n=1 Tax=Xanthomarina sp. TaxID=1931211 RepID=UPI002CD99C82|nr:MgtC/SapB family protein [Xanthomarina sp.]HLV38527.1 MgtC/SapB family protein [Xanthomarina sp.]